MHPNSHALEFKGEKSIKTDVSPALRATDYKFDTDFKQYIQNEGMGELEDVCGKGFHFVLQ